MHDSASPPRTTVLAIAAIFLLILSNPLRAEVVEARRAYDFVDSLGVVTHVSRPWGVLNNSGWSTVIDRIDEAGFRYVRTTITKNKGRERVEDAYERYGIKFNLRIDTRPLDGGDKDRTHLNPDRLDEMVKMTMAMEKEENIDAILSYEGPNEYNGQETYNSEWDIELRDFMLQLYQRVKTDPKIADRPVIAPSIKNRKYEHYLAMGDISDRTDRGNLHSYNSGQQPTYDLDNRIADAKIVTPDHPIWITEYGNRVADTKRVSEYSQAKYLARFAAEFFIRPDVERVFQYQIIDEKSISESPGKAWGLLRHNFSRRPAFYAMKNTIALLDDPSADFTPGSLDYDLIGDVTDVHSFLVQKNSGTFYLVLWQDVESWDWRNHQDLRPPDRSLSLVLNSPVDVARIYLPTGLDIDDPEDGRLPLRSYDKPSEIQLSVPDQLLVVEIVRGGDLAATAGADRVAGDAPLTVQFSGVADPPGANVTYAWDFGDGSISSGANPSHTYGGPGTYTAVLTVDDGSDTAQDTVEITALANDDTVSPRIPTGLTAELAPGNVIVLSWRASTDNVGVVGYRIYDDNEIKGTTTDVSYAFQAQRKRWYSLKITAIDAAGNESAKSDRLKAYIYKTRLVIRS